MSDYTRRLKPRVEQDLLASNPPKFQSRMFGTIGNANDCYVEIPGDVFRTRDEADADARAKAAAWLAGKATSTVYITKGGACCYRAEPPK